MIPALHRAEFLRYGVMHRNSYLYSPDCLTRTFRLKGDAPIYLRDKSPASRATSKA